MRIAGDHRIGRIGSVHLDIGVGIERRAGALLHPGVGRAVGEGDGSPILGERGQPVGAIRGKRARAVCDHSLNEAGLAALVEPTSTIN
jgi:hypothetical protein